MTYLHHLYTQSRYSKLNMRPGYRDHGPPFGHIFKSSRKQPLTLLTTTLVTFESNIPIIPLWTYERQQLLSRQLTWSLLNYVSPSHSFYCEWMVYRGISRKFLDRSTFSRTLDTMSQFLNSHAGESERFETKFVEQNMNAIYAVVCAVTPSCRSLKSLHMAHQKTWRHLQNRKYITYRNAARGGRSNEQRP